MSKTWIRYWGGRIKRPRDVLNFSVGLGRARSGGWRTYLVCSQPPDDLELLKPLLNIGVRILYSPRPRCNFDMRTAKRVHDLCRRLRCDVFQCDNMHTSPLIGAALAGVPVRLWFKRSMQPAFEQCREMTLRDRVAISVRVSCWLATRVIAVSKAVKMELVRLGVAGSKCVVMNNPAEEQFAGDVDRANTRALLGYDEKTLVYTAVGHAVAVKGWDVLIRAFAVIAPEVPEAQLLLVGSFDAEHERACYGNLKSLVASYGLGDRVRFAGRFDDPVVALGASDVFVMPSRSEGCGNVLTEAMCAGLPCISSRVGIAPDIIRHKTNGLLVTRADHGELAKAMLLLARSPETRMRIMADVRKRRYVPTFKEYAGSLFDLCQSLLEARA